MPLIIEKQAKMLFTKNEGAKLFNKEIKPSGYNSKNTPTHFFFFFATSYLYFKEHHPHQIEQQT